MKSILLTGAALVLTATSAQAQLLGGGLGGAVRGAGSLDVPVTTVRNSTRGTLDGAARTTGSQSADRKSGRVKADRNAQAQGSGALDQAVSSPLGALSGSGSAGAQGSGSANADAQLIGTDAVRPVVGQATGTARGVAGSVAATGRSAAGAAIGSAQGAAGSASGSASGTASGVFSGAAGQLALAGSAAAAGEGAFGVAPGMEVIDSSGDSIGQVRQVVADSRGQVRQVLVSTDRGDALLPAANFDAAGSLLVSGMSEGRVERVAERQGDDGERE